MPNWSENNLTVYGVNNPDQLKEFINKGVIDGTWKMGRYNPMPEGLKHTISPSNSAMGREYVNDWEVKSMKDRLKEQPDNIKKLEDKLANCEPELLVYNKRQLEKAKEPIIIPELIPCNNNTEEKCKKLIEKYGFDNWYDWCVNNWGTKWDAEDEVLDIEDDRINIVFNTAWCVPERLLNKIQLDYPDLYIECFFMDESGTPSGVLYTDPDNAGELICESSEARIVDDLGNEYYYDGDQDCYFDIKDNSYTNDEFWDLDTFPLNPFDEVELWFYKLL